MMEVGKTKLVLVDEDDGYRYVATQLAALRHYLIDDQMGWLIYVGEANQKAFYDPCFDDAKGAKWLPADDGKPTPKVSFLGLVTEPSLVGIDRLIHDVKMSFKEMLLQRDYPEDDELEKMADELACGGIKFAILQNVGSKRATIGKLIPLGFSPPRGILHSACNLSMPLLVDLLIVRKYIFKT
ncbi:hypothetical protein C5167_011757 [Papaver somniferum]|uniref:arginine--tRNA ligase, cytoplasmic-like n=1 Tax=Papaver somniferum TaxID=3469 RepID=UPI000E703067|nr:arginine--tRNA ligase, cytoplasmic-like [Papaver somniferum]XP_026437246.1 arginine--tRNA ligase, cytoplasmic-like [Papaver somniferum]RZC89398.1 hypothetical protein C5167_011757 [Papaver somniferum]